SPSPQAANISTTGATPPRRLRRRRVRRRAPPAGGVHPCPPVCERRANRSTWGEPSSGFANRLGACGVSGARQAVDKWRDHVDGVRDEGDVGESPSLATFLEGG